MVRDSVACNRVACIGATTTRDGLQVQAERDTGSYPTKIKVPGEELAAVHLTRMCFMVSGTIRLRHSNPILTCPSYFVAGP